MIHRHAMARIVGLGLWLAVSCANLASADEQVLISARDAALYFDAAGDLANGAGDFMFTGSSNDAKRALLAFDIAGSIPAGSTIESAELTLTMSRTIVPGINTELYRVTRDWNEGPTDAPAAEGGGGASAAGDVTWLHTFYDGMLWDTPGGDIAPEARAAMVVVDEGDYTWGSNALMVADVQEWLDDPATNFGWLVRGPESPLFFSTKRFNTREHPDAATRPRLRLEFTPAPSTSALEVPTTGRVGSWLLAALLAMAAAAHLRRG